MSSLKMTFSLTSLILLMAFVAMPVLAHDISDPDATPPVVVSGHEATDADSHPVVKSVTLLGEAADGYVGNDSFVVEVKFEAANTANKISVPTVTTVVVLDSTTSNGFSTVETHKINDTTYRIRLDATGSLTSGDEETISVREGGAENIYNPAAPATGDDPARAMVTYDNIAPNVEAGTAQPMAGESFPLNNELEEAFDVVFVITDEAASGTDSTAMTLDGTSFELMASPDTVTFSNTRYLGANKFAATVTPKAVTADETDATSVTITASVMDKAGNSNVGTAMVTLAARMVDGTVTVTVDPATATITVSDHMTSGVKGTFNVRVEFTPATGGSAVTGFDHSGLSVMDSSTPAKTVSVMPAMGTETNPIAAPLMADDLYVATLEYDTRFNFTLPLTVTIDQTSQKTHNPMESATVGTAAVIPPDPPGPAKAKATFSGTLSLTEQSIITVTFDKAVTGLTTADFTVTGGDPIAVNAKTVTAPTVANTVWEVAITPDNNPFTESITVTIDAASTLAEPAMTMGSLTTRVADGTLSSIVAATGADDTAAFEVTLTFAAALPTGTDVIAADLKLTPTTATVTGIASLDRISWQVQIKPTTGMDTKIELSDAGKLKFAYAGAAVTVMKKGAAITPGDITVTPSADGMTVTLSGTIGADDFVVIGAASLPDLQEFFDIGGTIDLDDGDAAADANLRNVVISEILWGLDFGATAITDQKQWQFIELYNTTNAAIDLTGWMLKFAEGRPTTDAIDIDQVSNRPPLHTGWIVDIGQSGRVTSTRAVDVEATITAINIVSMYRNIKYATVTKPDHDANATENRKKQLAGVPSGNAKGSWIASKRRDPNTPNGQGVTGAQAARWIYASRDEQHYTTTAILTASTVSKSPFVINEVGNGSGDTNDWVEIRNLDSAEKSLKNYHLSIVTAVGTDTSLVNFKDKDIKVPGNGFIVLVNTSPTNTDLAAGRNAAVAADDQILTGATSVYYINGNLKLPANGKFNLILRNAHDKLKASSHFVDVIGGQVYKDVAKATSLWPLIAAGAPHGDVIDGQGRDLKEGYVYIRKNAGALGAIYEHHLGRAGYTGVGYDRAALKSDANGGTPGYDNGAVKDKIKDGATVVLTDGAITISEIMLDTGPGIRSLPQWIELYNSSMTQAVNLNGWKLTIENDATDTAITTRVDATITLKSMTISPNQTVMIVTTSGRNSDPDHFPRTRVVNLWTDKDHRTALGMQSRTEQVFSTVGLYLKLTDTKSNIVDEFGNLDGDRRTRTETPKWTFPMNKEEGDERRSSLIRRYTDGTEDGAGTTEDAWVLASETNFADLIGNTFYGDADDFGTPGFRGGGPLPVSLSKFRPERLDDGAVVVRWITESELNNAGFNILRSETRNGQFTQINTSLIAGQGTTSERTTYEWKDSTAKPNVVYYYQIQDVSLDGNVQILRQSRLKGNVSAAGKITTTWGELKALQ